MVSDEVKKLRAQKIVDWEARMDELYQKYLTSLLTQEVVDYLCSDCVF